tara:strand:- start:2572 stop:3150 length:579 start_codon:yes stop_codon:yes gene_type:complete
MARKANTLQTLFKSVQALTERMKEDSSYDNEIRQFFKVSIPSQDMRNDELEKYLRDQIVMTEMIVPKLRGWLNGFIEKDLKGSTSNNLLNEDILEPGYNPPLPVKLLKQLYQLKESERTIYNWLDKDKVLPSSNSGTRLYHRVEFEHLLRNKGKDFDQDFVKKNIPDMNARMKKLNEDKKKAKKKEEKKDKK